MQTITRYNKRRKDRKEKGDPRTPGKRKEMWTAGLRYSWKKIEAAAQRELDDHTQSVAYASLGVTRQNRRSEGRQKKTG